MSIEQEQRGDEYLFQTQTETERSTHCRVRSIGEATAKNGRKYTVVEFDNGYKKPVFNPKLIAGLHEGDAVELAEHRNERGFWDLTSLQLVPEAAQPEAPKSNGSETPRPEEIVQERGRERYRLEDREYRMASMNASTSSATLLSALINTGLVVPKTRDDTMELFAYFHEEILDLHLHNPNANESGK